jgi:hypothetical protein
VGARHRLILCLVSIAAIGGAPACKRKEQAPPSPAPSARPSADRLAKGEIPEGKERAFTLPLPLHSSVKARFPGSIHVASAHTQEELSNFVRARVKDGKTSSGASETRFEKVVAISDPTHTLSIEVRSTALLGEFRSQMIVNDVTPPPPDPNLTNEDRWKKAGLTPDGKLLDPKHMQ